MTKRQNVDSVDTYFSHTHFTACIPINTIARLPWLHHFWEEDSMARIRRTSKLPSALTVSGSGSRNHSGYHWLLPKLSRVGQLSFTLED